MLQAFQVVSYHSLVIEVSGFENVIIAVLSNTWTSLQYIEIVLLVAHAVKSSVDSPSLNFVAERSILVCGHISTSVRSWLLLFAVSVADKSFDRKWALGFSDTLHSL